MLKWLALFGIQAILGSNLDHVTDYPGLGFSWFSAVIKKTPADTRNPQIRAL
jgi:hypothetical protein